MIRANLLLDDGSDPRDVGGMLGLALGAGVVILCIAFVVIADAQIRNDSAEVESANTELHGQISELSTNVEQLRSMNVKIEDIESFITILDHETRGDLEAKKGLTAFSAVFGDRPRRTSERREYEQRGWDDRWTIAALDSWSLTFSDAEWVFTGSGASVDDLQEVARRVADLDGVENEGFESITVTTEEPLSYAFEWTGTLNETDEGGQP